MNPAKMALGVGRTSLWSEEWMVRSRKLFTPANAKSIIIHFEDTLGQFRNLQNKVRQTGNMEVRLHSRLIKINGKEEADQIVIRDEEHTGRCENDSSTRCAILSADPPRIQKTTRNLETKDGYIVTDEKQETNLAGVYAAGDICVKQVRQAATAVADGTVAAIHAAAYIKAQR
ncbi:MAG: NAD(P)/FAD-dependent oxidoreductase [Sellimonas intestinalis]